jgi:hypothetical protein
MTGDDSTPVCFARLNAAELVAGKFKAPSSWQVLGGDKSRLGTRFALGDEDFPGSVLCKLGLGRDEVAEEESWEDEVQTCFDKLAYSVRVHVYQCRNLPAADADGGIDPYIRARFCGNVAQTVCKLQSTDPLFYQTLEFSVYLEENRAVAPELVLELWDFDQWSSDDLMGVLRLPMSSKHCQLLPADAKLPDPKWVSFGRPGLAAEPTGAADERGQILLSVQLVEKDDIDQELPSSGSLLPETRPAQIEIVALGVRGMEPFSFQNIVMPLLEFQVGDGMELGSAGASVGEDQAGASAGESAGRRNFTRTSASKKPSGPQANFLEHIVIECELPVKPIYCPNLSIKCFDSRFGGFDMPMVGSASISLFEKLPWNSKAFIPPQQEGIEVQTKKAKKKRDKNSKEAEAKKKKKKEKEKRKKEKAKKAKAAAAAYSDAEAATMEAELEQAEGEEKVDAEAEQLGSEWVEQTFMQVSGTLTTL